MCASITFEQNPIIDAFLLCGHSLKQFQTGFKWEPSKVITQITSSQTFFPCVICNVQTQNGWIEHAIANHCDERQIRSNQLKLFRLSKGNECYICNLVYANEEERSRHIDHHLKYSLSFAKKLPLQRTTEIIRLSAQEQALRMKSYLHFNMYKNRNIYLFIAIPSWLRGLTVKEKLCNLDTPTYFPVALSSDTRNIFQKGIKIQHYDVYQVMVFTPTLTDTFNGIRDYRRMYGKLLIRLLASIQQQPMTMKFIKLVLSKSEKDPQLFGKYLLHITDEDINEILQDVLINRYPVICEQEFLEEAGCTNWRCNSFIHFKLNFRLTKAAAEPIQEYASCTRHYKLNFQLGEFDHVKNPHPDRWREFATDLVAIRRFHIAHPCLHYVYLALCTNIVNTTDLPSTANIQQFMQSENEQVQYKAYVGLSKYGGIPPHHFNDDANEDEEEEDAQQFEEIDRNHRINEDGTRIIRAGGGTELTKAIRSGFKALYMMRLQMFKNYQKAEMLEAAIQFYGWLANEFEIDNPVRIINLRLELFSLSFLTLQDLEKIIELIKTNVLLFYDSHETFPDNLQNYNWGLFEKPYFLNEMDKLPL